jgi:hypothetical protein
MSRLADIGRLLLHLRLRLIEECGDQGLTVDDPEFPGKIEELHLMSEVLRISTRDLKSSLHAANAREQRLRDIPRENRFGPAASVKDEKRVINELMREAAEIQRLVEGLIGRIYSGNEMEGVHSIAELIEKMTGHEPVTEQVAGSGLAYVPAAQAHFHASPEAAVIMAYVALRGLVLVAKKITNKRRP